MRASGAVELAVQHLAQSWNVHLESDTQYALFVAALLDEVAAEEDLFTLYDPEFDLITNSANMVSRLLAGSATAVSRPLVASGDIRGRCPILSRARTFRSHASPAL